MDIEALRARFPDEVRKAWEIDRILQPGKNGHVQIDLRANYSAANLRMGAGSERLGSRVQVASALSQFDEYLGDAVVSSAYLWGAKVGNKGLPAMPPRLLPDDCGR